MYKIWKFSIKLSLRDYPVLSSIGLILSVTCWLIFIAFYMTTKNKHKYKKLVYFNRASLFIIVYTYSIVTKSVVFLCVSLTIALLKLLVSKVFKYSIKEQVSRNVNLANIYPSILVLSVDMILIKTSVKASLLIGAVTLVIFIMLATVTKTELFEVQEGFGYKLLGDTKFIDIDANKSVLYKAYVMNAICVSLLYFGIYSIYALVFKDISIISAIPRIFGVFIFLLIVVTTFITLSKKEEEKVNGYKVEIKEVFLCKYFNSIYVASIIEYYDTTIHYSSNSSHFGYYATLCN